MKIYIQPVNKEFQPEGIANPYPQYNNQFGVEQDILVYLKKNNFTIEDKEKADWIYLPIFWTRWHVNHGWSSWGRDILQSYVNSLNLDFKKTFTVCQYDDGPIADLQEAVIFLSSRKTEKGIDIPLLASPIRTTLKWEDKDVLASFSGIYKNHPFRERMAKSLSGEKNIFLYNGNYGTEHFMSLMERSKIALCPRGYGGSSFRFYEAMQLGSVPVLIGDIDIRPFKKYIYWDSCSFYLDNPDKTKDFLKNISNENLEAKNRNLSVVWNEIKYGSWCKYLIKELYDRH